MWEPIDAGWSDRELSELELGDKRLESRARQVAEELSGKPEAPINQASEDWAATKAAYRFFDNDNASAQKILSPHQRRTVDRMRGEGVVLVIQDTTYLNYDAHEYVTGLGPIGDSRSNAQGLIMHSALAVTPAGLPLGLLSQRIWARSENKVAHQRKRKTIETKESYRWIETLRETQRIAAPNTRVVTVCDRESDIYEFFVEADKLDTSFVVRASWNRRVCNEAFSNLWEMLQAQEVVGHTTVQLPHRSIHAVNTLDLEVRFAPVTLKVPNRSASQAADAERLPAVTLYAVYVKETGAPVGSEPVEWLLLTNLAVQTVEEALEKVRWYARRWSIEVFHRILKSGCTVERCQLETAERLVKYLTLMSIVAWRIFWMTHFKRTDPSAPATQVLTKTELRALPLLFKKKPPYPPSRMPTVAQVVVAIARLGGFLARKSDKNPGPTAIWRGWQRLADAAIVVGTINGQ